MTPTGRFTLSAVLLASVCAAGVAQTPSTPAAPPPTEIYLASLDTRDGRPVVGEPVNITRHPGYDNQPAFVPDGGAILFTSMRGGGQTDIYRYDIAGTRIVRLTDTPESEYSPTVTPDGEAFSVIRVEADATQRLWQFGMDGRSPRLVVAGIKPVGYHVWVDPATLVLFVLGAPPTLQVADAKTGRAETVARATATGRGRRRAPGGSRSSTRGAGRSLRWSARSTAGRIAPGHRTASC